LGIADVGDDIARLDVEDDGSCIVHTIFQEASLVRLHDMAGALLQVHVERRDQTPTCAALGTGLPRLRKRAVEQVGGVVGQGMRALG
jgi:hypothetical protein